MNINKLKTLRRSRRRAGIRKRIQGTAQTPRLSIYRSGKHMYAQLIDDMAGKTLAAASTTQNKGATGGNIAAATQVGKDIAEKARTAGVETVAFDRGGFNYHGRVKALAQAAREAGLKF